jgi:hypothetical protein
MLIPSHPLPCLTLQAASARGPPCARWCKRRVLQGAQRRAAPARRVSPPACAWRFPGLGPLAKAAPCPTLPPGCGLASGGCVVPSACHTQRLAGTAPPAWCRISGSVAVDDCGRGGRGARGEEGAHSGQWEACRQAAGSQCVGWELEARGQGKRLALCQGRSARRRRIGPARGGRPRGVTFFGAPRTGCVPTKIKAPPPAQPPPSQACALARL